jgi:hypothetical protein
VAGHEVTNFVAYQVTFLVAAVMCLGGVPWSLAIRDADAARTMAAPRSHPPSAPETQPSVTQPSP